MFRIACSVVLIALGLAGAIHAQSPAPGVPRLIPASGLLFDQAGKPLNGNNVKITFSVYANAGDQDPLWSETLKVQVTAGRYETLIGSSSPDGVPSSVFAAGDARWLGVTADKAAAPPRSLLVSVPYALTSDDSSKLGGHPASAFVLKDDPDASKSTATPSGWKQGIDEEAAARMSADTTLQNSVDAETAARNAADTNLQNNLDSEAAARAAADTTLQNNVDAEAATRNAADTTLQNNVDTEQQGRESKDTELAGKIDSTKSELDGKLSADKTELNGKIDAAKGELHSKIDATKSELNAKIFFETSKVTSEQDAKLLSLKNELQNDSSQKVTELDLKKTSKEEFEQEKTKKELELTDLKQKKLSRDDFDLEKQKKDFDIEDLKQKKLEKHEFETEKQSKQALIDELHLKKLSKEEYLLEKQAKDADIDDLKQKKLSKEEYLLEKIAKEAEFEDLKQRKLEKAEHLAEKLAKDAEILELKSKKLEKLAFEAEKAAKDAELTALSNKVNSLATFVVSFDRDPNGDTPDGSYLCADPHVVTGIAIGSTSDPLVTAAPQCSQVTGAGVRADGILIGMLSGPVAMPGLQQIPPALELTCPAGHVAVGLNVAEGGAMFAECRRLFSNAPSISSAASVVVGAGQTSQSCEVGFSLVGLRPNGGVLEILCR